MSRDPKTMRASARPRSATWNAPSKSLGCPHFERLELHLQCARGALRLSKLGIGMIRIPQNGDAGCRRHRVFEQLDRLSSQLVVDPSDAGDVASRTPEARHEAALDRIVAHNHDDRNSRGRFLDDRGLLASERENNIWIEPTNSSAASGSRS